MAAYTSLYYGPPRNGRFVRGDTVTDAAGVVWRCVRDGRPGNFIAANDPSGNAGTVNALTGMSVAELGGGAVNKTKITFAAASFAVPDLAAYAGRKLYTFPEGRILVLGATATIAWAVTTDRTATINLNANMDWSVGTATASNVTLASTMVDIIPKVDAGLTAAGSTLNTATSGQLAASAHFDGTSAAKELYMNISFPTNTEIDADGTVAATGSLTVVWAHLGDV